MYKTFLELILLLSSDDLLSLHWLIVDYLLSLRN
jgi:hypothetical protein